ncbi:hypothetical protein BGZ72_001305 [Mortierella alpina]|nr:hypothetical protein BGZ72_001305 [Mortierella alpina]
MPACLFCAEDRSVDTTHSGTLDDSHLSHLSNLLNGPPSPPQSSPILETMHSPVDQAHTPVQGQKPDREPEFIQIAIDEFDQDEFSGLLEDMDMTDLSDLTTSHGPTPTLASFQGSESDQGRMRDQGYGSVPACIKDSRSNQESVREQTQPRKQTATPPPQILVHVYDESRKPSAPSFSEIQQSQATVPPTPYPRRRRRLIEEEPSQITSEEADVIQDERPQGDNTAVEISKDINTYAARPQPAKHTPYRCSSSVTQETEATTKTAAATVAIIYPSDTPADRCRQKSTPVPGVLAMGGSSALKFLSV